MTFVRADDGWIGLLIFLVAIALQVISALRKGKTAKPPVPRTPPGPARAPQPRPAARRPVPVPAPWKPEPAYVPAPPPAEPSPARLPPKLRDLFDELSVPPASVPEPVPYTRAEATPPPSFPSGEAIVAAARAMEEAERAQAAPARAASPALSRLRLQDRAAWQRAFVLSELLQPPLALRPDALARTAHF